MLDLSIVIVNWNAGDFLQNCLHSIYEQTTGIAFEVLMVDNGSTDGSPEMVENCFPRVQLIRNRQNVGFAKANNQAIRASKGKYVLLLNPDTIVLDGALVQMVMFLDRHPDIGALGCKILTADGQIDFRGGRHFPTLWSEFCIHSGLAWLFPTSERFGGHLMSYWDHEDSREVDLLVGACIMVRRDVIYHVGLMDEDFFMYADDVEWCYRIKQVGWKVFYYADAAIVHLGEGSVRFAKSPIRIEGLRSMNLFFAKHYGRLSAWVHKSLLLFLAIAKLLFFGSKFLLIRDAGKRGWLWEKIRLHWRVLQWSFVS